jgi:hypothetical protein
MRELAPQRHGLAHFAHDQHLRAELDGELARSAAIRRRRVSM